MEDKKRRSIAFDLKRSELIRDFGQSGMAMRYQKLAKALQDNGFERHQQSTFISKEALYFHELLHKIKKIINSNKWVLEYKHSIVFFDTPEQFDAVAIYEDAIVKEKELSEKNQTSEKKTSLVSKLDEAREKMEKQKQTAKSYDRGKEKTR